jgi:hypothetical protein
VVSDVHRYICSGEPIVTHVKYSRLPRAAPAAAGLTRRSWRCASSHTAARTRHPSGTRLDLKAKWQAATWTRCAPGSAGTWGPSAAHTKSQLTATPQHIEEKCLSSDSVADKIAPARCARRCKHASCTHPLARRVLLLLDLLDAVPVRLVALVVRRVVLGLGHRGVARAPALTHPAKVTPAANSQVFSAKVTRSKSISQGLHMHTLAAPLRELSRHTWGCTCQGRARSPLLLHTALAGGLQAAALPW